MHNSVFQSFAATVSTMRCAAGGVEMLNQRLAAHLTQIHGANRFIGSSDVTLLQVTRAVEILSEGRFKLRSSNSVQLHGPAHVIAVQIDKQTLAVDKLLADIGRIVAKAPSQLSAQTSKVLLHEAKKVQVAGISSVLFTGRTTVTLGTDIQLAGEGMQLTGHSVVSGYWAVVGQLAVSSLHQVAGLSDLVSVQGSITEVSSGTLLSANSVSGIKLQSVDAVQVHVDGGHMQLPGITLSDSPQFLMHSKAEIRTDTGIVVGSTHSLAIDAPKQVSLAAHRLIDIQATAGTIEPIKLRSGWNEPVSLSSSRAEALYLDSNEITTTDGIRGLLLSANGAMAVQARRDVSIQATKMAMQSFGLERPDCNLANGTKHTSEWRGDCLAKSAISNDLVIEVPNSHQCVLH